MRERVARALFEDRAPRTSWTGRYRVLDELGRGGMGVVHRAYDPKLRREVALKVVRVDRLGERAQARMIREAQAMARLSHPNVVGVHDVELDGPHGVVVVMEYVDGCSLHDWLRAEPRSWTKILPPFLAAGRGLAAAHAAGMLHRDFKPSNVLIGSDGRARVADFGLACSRTEEPTPCPETRPASPPLGPQLTTCGVLLGTLDFMAPELLHGHEATALTDQYAFCVSLWWALAERPPFARGADQERAKLEGPPAWDGQARVPRRLVSALRRGLSPDPSARWPSMEALLDALTGTTRARVGTGALALAIAGLGVTLVLDEPEPPEPSCSGAARLGEAWDDDRRSAVRRNLLERSGPGERAWTQARDRLDAYATAWSSMFEHACETAMGATPEVMLEPAPAVRCLHRGRLELEATTQRLTEPESLDHLDALLEGLPSLERCRHASETPPDLRPPPDEAPAVDGIRRRLAIAKSLRLSGRYEPALEEVERARSTTTALSFSPIGTAVELEHGLALSALGRFDEAEAAFERAQHLATRWAQTDEQVAVTLAVMHHATDVRSRPQEALVLAPMARGLAARSGDPSDLAITLAVIADARSARGEDRAAVKELDEAIRIWVEHRGRLDTRTAIMLKTRAAALMSLGELDEAERDIRESLAIRTELQGPQHPLVVSLRGDLAGVLFEQGRVREAEDEVRTILGLLVETFGPDHPRVAIASSNLAVMVSSRGGFSESAELSRRALEILTKAGMSATAHAGRIHGNLADALGMLGDFQDAERHMRAAVDIHARSTGPQSPSLGHHLRNLGDFLTLMGRFDEAEPELRRAVRVLAEASDRRAGLAHRSLGLLLYEQGKDHEGLAELRTAVEILERTEGSNEALVRTRIHLADQLHALGRLDEAEAELDAVVDARPEPWLRFMARARRGRIGLERGEAPEVRLLLEPQWTRYDEQPSLRDLARAQTGFVLARALWADHSERERALEIVRTVADDDRAMGLAGPRHRRRIRRWLAARE